MIEGEYRKQELKGLTPFRGRQPERDGRHHLTGSAPVGDGDRATAEVATGEINTKSVFAEETVARLRRRAALAWTAERYIPPEPDDLAGLALSGGGIRSAAFCIGALQALQEPFGQKSVLPQFDYLSSVSGGGYAAASLIRHATRKADCFPFGHPNGDTDDVIGHIRDCSSYLMTAGPIRASLKAVIIYLRAMAISALALAPAVLAFATLLAVLHRILPENAPSLALAGYAAIGLVIILLLWAFLHTLVSIAPRKWPNSLGGRLRHLSGSTAPVVLGWVIVLVLALWLSLQAMACLTDLAGADLDTQATPTEITPTDIIVAITAVIKPTITAVLTAVIGLFSFLRPLLGKAAAEAAQNLTGRLLQWLSRIALVLGGAVLPLFLWLLALLLAIFMVEWANTEKIGGCWLVACALGLLITWLIVQAFVDIDANSVSELYRIGLAGAFLAAPERAGRQAGKPADGHEGNLEAQRFLLSEVEKTRVPYPILNAALSTRGSPNANRRGRNADFFTMTPLHFGSPHLGYCSMQDAEEQDGMTLAKAMAISGAAVAPNMGLAFQAPLLGFTLAMLGIRLGRWVRRPDVIQRQAEQDAIQHPTEQDVIQRQAEKKDSLKSSCWRHLQLSLPPATPLNLWLEALGRSGRWLVAPDRRRLLPFHGRRMVLSDGGHIDNLGLVELLRRRCQLIVVVDAECDPDIRCSSLSRAMRLARIDLGVTIRIDTRPIAASHAEGKRVVDSGLPDTGDGPRLHAAAGLIHYPARPEEGLDEMTGHLVYLKASLTGDEFAPIQLWRRNHPAFPHESTRDQFFNEEQFEAYRALGAHIARDATRGRSIIRHTEITDEDWGRLCTRLRWKP